MSLPSQKEYTAIQLRYVGDTFEMIARKINVPQRTIEGWFSADGKLFDEHIQFNENMNRRRKQEFENKMALSDEETLIITTNVIRQFARKFQARKAPLVRDDGTAVADENGNAKMVEIEPDVSVSMGDVKNAWHIQRIVCGKPTNYEKAEYRDTSEQETAERIRRMGLTDEDFTDENLEETMKKVDKFLRQQE